MATRRSTTACHHVLSAWNQSSTCLQHVCHADTPSVTPVSYSGHALRLALASVFAHSVVPQWEKCRNSSFLIGQVSKSVYLQVLFISDWPGKSACLSVTLYFRDGLVWWVAVGLPLERSVSAYLIRSDAIYCIFNVVTLIQMWIVMFYLFYFFKVVVVVIVAIFLAYMRDFWGRFWQISPTCAFFFFLKQRSALRTNCTP